MESISQQQVIKKEQHIDDIGSTTDLIPVSIGVSESTTTDLHPLPMGVSESTTTYDQTSSFATDLVFNNRDELCEWIRLVGKKVGTVVVITKSNSGCGYRTPRVTLSCERSGKFRSAKICSTKSEKPRKIGTKKCDCPFTIKGIKMKQGDQWKINVVSGFHNHPPAQQLEGHSFAGRLTNEEKTMVVDLSKKGMKPKDVLCVIKERNEDNVSTMSTIYNARYYGKVLKRAGRSVIQELFKNLVSLQYIERHRSNSGNEITDLFWAHPGSIQLAHCFPTVLLMDCTYKTNRYKMPLFEIVGITSTSRTFSVAFVYMEAEKEDNYTWALHCLKQVLEPNSFPSVVVTDRELALMNALKFVFPGAHNFLCRFHISRNVTAKCKKFFSDGKAFKKFLFKFNEIVLSSTEAEYKINTQNLETSFSGYRGALDYVFSNWLANFKEYFVAAWTDQIVHFGNNTTNRVEGQHSVLKRALGNSLSNLDTSWDIINRMLLVQHVEIKASFEKSLTIVKHQYTSALFKELRGFISLSALDIIVHESAIGTSASSYDVKACGCDIRRTHGLPCGHEIAQYKHEGRPIPLSCIHPHWKKLTDKPNVPLVDEFDCTPDIDIFYQVFKNATPTTKMDMLKKLKEVSNPVSTVLSEPKVKIRTRGRPKSSVEKKMLKFESSTKRTPSEFEYVLAEEKLMNESIEKKPKVEKENASHNQTNKIYSPIQLLELLPSYWSPFIQDIKNVEPDGNCGFRTVADFLFQDENQWCTIRRDLVCECDLNMVQYAFLFGDRYDEIYGSLKYFKSPAPLENWMSMPDTGHVIASCYNIPVIYISNAISVTLLPLRTPPTSLQPEIFVMGYINDNHFIRVIPISNCPIPPIANSWYVCHTDGATGWGDLYTEMITRYESMFGRSDQEPNYMTWQRTVIKWLYTWSSISGAFSGVRLDDLIAGWNSFVLDPG